MKKSEQGNCPSCGNDIVEYVGVLDEYSEEMLADYQRNVLEYVFVCSECGQKYMEVYELKYLRSEVIK